MEILILRGDTTGSAYNFVAGTLSFSSDITDGIYFEVTQTTYGQYAGVALIDAFILLVLLQILQ